MLQSNKHSMHILIASTNPAKIEATKRGFAAMFPEQTCTFEGCSVPSGVSSQPRSDQETFQGAKNRAQNAKATHPNADYYVGLEGGVEKTDNETWGLSWVVVVSKTGQIGKARTGAYVFPKAISDLLDQGLELGEVDDRVFGLSNSKQSLGAIGILTSNAIDRASYFTHAVTLALIPFKNRHLYELTHLRP